MEKGDPGCDTIQVNTSYVYCNINSNLRALAKDISSHREGSLLLKEIRVADRRQQYTIF